jgi:hypothetical protein
MRELPKLATAQAVAMPAASTAFAGADLDEVGARLVYPTGFAAPPGCPETTATADVVRGVHGAIIHKQERGSRPSTASEAPLASAGAWARIRDPNVTAVEAIPLGWEGPLVVLGEQQTD